MQMYVLHRLRRSAACSCVRSYPPVRSADLSGQVLDTPLALEWGRRILEEFRLQAALEATAGLPLTTVASGDMETTMKGQHFFAAKVSDGAAYDRYISVHARVVRVSSKYPRQNRGTWKILGFVQSSVCAAVDRDKVETRRTADVGSGQT